MKWVLLIFFLIISVHANSMGIAPFESPLIETDSTSPRFEAMGGVSIGVDDPEGDFRFNPAKAAFLIGSIFYSYPRISIFSNKQKDSNIGEDYSFTYESNYTRVGAIPELGAIFISESGLFYGFRTNYEFDYSYIKDKSSSTYNSSNSTNFDRTKQINHIIPVSFLIGKKTEKVSLGLEAGAGYEFTDSDTVGDEIYGPGKQNFSGLDVWIKPGLLVFADKNTRFSLFLETNVYSDGKFKISDEETMSGQETYDTKNEKFNGEIDFIKNYEKFSFGFLFGFFSEKIKLSISEDGFNSSISFTEKEGFKFGIGISSRVIPSTYLGSDIVYAIFDTDLPAGILPLNEYITFSKIEDTNIQWKTGIEQQFGDNYFLRFGYIITWNFFESHYTDFEENSSSSGYKFIYNSVTSGFSYKKGNVRFDYLLRFNNLLSIVNTEVINTFGLVVDI